ncbi:HAD family hydrolase [Streptomyces collinus]|uniref:HAD family hydrolase n=1 Tax=Streptomyces collinus TaxID=42684 RepID=UPI0034354428
MIIAGNQTTRAGELLRSLRLPADLILTSGELGVAKPQLEFFDEVLSAAQVTPDVTLYVGDHPANDIFPAKKAGLRTAHIRRGPWGCLWGDSPDVTKASD